MKNFLRNMASLIIAVAMIVIAMNMIALIIVVAMVALFITVVWMNKMGLCSICLIKKISKTAKPSFFVFVGKWHVKCVQNLHMMHTKKGKRIWKQQKKSEK